MGIGAIAKQLFGALDDSDGQHYDEIIDRISKEEKGTLILTKEQTHIVSSIIQNFNWTIDLQYENEKTFNEKINKINERFNNLNTRVNDNHINDILKNHFIFLGHFVVDLENSINNLITTSLCAKVTKFTQVQLVLSNFYNL